MNTVKRMLDVLDCQVEDILKSQVMGNVPYYIKWEHCFWRANELHHCHAEEVQEISASDSGQVCQQYTSYPEYEPQANS